MHVRPAREADFPGVLQIVNREIEHGFAHFGTTPNTEQDCRAWLADQARLPWLVATGDRPESPVLGYARATRWKERQAYDLTVEIGIYVRPDAQNRGMGKALYRELLPTLRRLGYRTVLAGIALPNPASIRLHESVGMTRAGTLPKVGCKRGRWIDVGYWAIHFPEEPGPAT